MGLLDKLGFGEGPLNQELRIQNEENNRRAVATRLDDFTQALQLAGGPTTPAGFEVYKKGKADPLIGQLLADNPAGPDAFINPEQKVRMDDLSATSAFRKKGYERTEKTVWPQEDTRFANEETDRTRNIGRQAVADSRVATQFQQEQEDRTWGLTEHAQDRQQTLLDRDIKNQVTAKELENMDVNQVLDQYRAMGGAESEAARTFLRNAAFANPKLAQFRLLRTDSFKTDASRRADDAAALKPQPEPELAHVQKITGVLADIAKIRDSNFDAATSKSKNPKLDVALSFLENKVLGQDPNETPSDLSGKYTLADMIAGYPQSTRRTAFDDTISPADLTTGMKNYAAQLEANGTPRVAARKQAAKEYFDLTASDTGTFQKVPKVDAAKIFDDMDTRQAAPAKGEVIVDTGDGQSTVPTRLADSGLSESEQAEFSTMEKMVGKSLPQGFNIRQGLKQNPALYKQLLQFIRDGIPDGKGGRRKLETSEIIKAITLG